MGQPMAASTSLSGSRINATFMSAGVTPAGFVLLAIPPAMIESLTAPPR